MKTSISINYNLNISLFRSFKQVQMEALDVANEMMCLNEADFMIQSDYSARKEPPRLDSLSRNVLVIVSDYLSFI